MHCFSCVSLVVVESTGGLERLLVNSLQAASIAIAIANPRKVKGFAIALGKAKTEIVKADIEEHLEQIE